MKVFLLVLCSFMAFKMVSSQTIKLPSKISPTTDKSVNIKIDGFYGILFGTSKISSKDIMKKKGWVIDEESTDYILFKKNRYLGRDAILILKFVNNSLYEGVAIFVPDLEAKILDLYNDVKNDVSLKYGLAKSYELYDYPYEKGDGHYLTAIEVGKAKFSSYWHEQINGLDTEGNIISLKITSNMSVVLVFQDDKRINDVILKQNEKKIEDL